MTVLPPFFDPSSGEFRRQATYQPWKMLEISHFEIESLVLYGRILTRQRKISGRSNPVTEEKPSCDSLYNAFPF